ncbi:response regulator [Paenibacillus cymbidii]|uniref:response regulator n=1 Tax=Paenibacillus cymbidii TaxID=1639034 RepID=UPI00143681D0|nr:response regulator [Paenibacillus cymbidii]
MFKVMIVDDEPFVIHGLRSRVDWESLDMELTGTAANGQDLLAMMAARPADLLITDVCMPHMDGLTLIERAKLVNPSLRCIVISAYSEFDYVKKALQHGVENYLLKPINESEFVETLAKTGENLARDRTARARASASASVPPDAIAFRTNILDRWVNGTIQDFELFERAELLHIDLSASAYRVCVLDVADAGGREPFACATELSELCRSVFLPVFAGEVFIDGSLRVVAVLHGPCAEESREAELRDALQRLGGEAAARGIRAFVAVSPVAAASAGVGECYASAVFYRHYRFLDPEALAVFCMRLPEASGLPTAEARMELQQFAAALRQGDLRQALQLAKRDVERHAGAGEGAGCGVGGAGAGAGPAGGPAGGPASGPAAGPALGRFGDGRGGMLPLVLCLVRTVIESGRVSDALPGTLAERLAGYPALRTREELQAWLARTIEEAIQAIGKRKGTYHLLVHLTLEQINKKYDAELSLKSLAGGFNVSPAYLGQLFKEETGKYFNDYLTHARLQASRALLLDTDMRIAEIVQRVGIPNQSYFNRIFKKTYGVSPMEFRRQNLQKQPS